MCQVDRYCFNYHHCFPLQELGIKHPLHRKKLVLAVKAINTKQDEKSAQLDHIWVTRKYLKWQKEMKKRLIMFLAYFTI